MTDHSINVGLRAGSDRLVARFAQEPFALVFSGQGFDWLTTLKTAVNQGASRTVAPLVEQANELIAPVVDQIAGTRTVGFDPIGWASDAKEISFDAAQAAISVPGIFVSQLAVLDVLESQGLDVDAAVTSLGHSQGILGVFACQDLTRAAEVLAIAQLVGAAVTRQARVTGLVAQGDAGPMVAIGNITREQLQQAIDTACGDLDENIRPTIGLRNARTTYVLVGRPEDNRKILDLLRHQAAKDAKAVENKLRGGAPFNPNIAPLDVQVGFHHPAMIPAVDQVVLWATEAGLNQELAREVATKVMVTPVDWVEQVRDAVAAGARWLLDVGPDTGVTFLTEEILAGSGAATLSVANPDGQALLFDADQAPELPRPYSDYAPTLAD
ncbi:MAG: 3-oxoacyl-ACP synthase, partial [Corynebacterium matruchotii]